jgi:integrase
VYKRDARQLTEVPGHPLHFGPPKSDAGRRVVVMPPVILPEVTAHLTDHADPDPEAVIFTSPSGGLLRHSNFYRRVWLPALVATSLPCVHFHDLRHAGNVLVANAGADARELMERMGHSTSRAALIYLHSTSARQRELAETVASRVRSELARPASCGTVWHDHRPGRNRS